MKATGSTSPPWALWLGVGLVAALCVVYAPLAMTYFLGFDDAAGGQWTRLQAALVSDSFSYDPRSIHGGQKEQYAAASPFLELHTLAGGLCLLLALPQFSGRLRRRRPALHRLLGRAFVVAAAVTLAGGYAYLAQTPSADVFSGPIFAAGLWALAIVTTVGLVLAIVHIRRRDVHAHQAWMALTFAFLLTAPVLRLLWILVARLDPLPMDAWDNNLVSSAVLLPISMVPALIWLSASRATRPVRRLEPARAAQIARWLAAASALAAAAALHEHLLRFVTGLDLVGGSVREAERAAFFRAPAGFLLMAGGAVLVAAGARRATAACFERAFRPRAAWPLLAGLFAGGGGALLVAATGDRDGVLGPAAAYFWAVYGAMQLGCAAGALWSRRPEHFALHGLGLLFLPLYTLLAVPAWTHLGLTPLEAYTLGAGLGFGQCLIVSYLVVVYGAEPRAKAPR